MSACAPWPAAAAPTAALRRPRPWPARWRTRPAICGRRPRPCGAHPWGCIATGEAGAGATGREIRVSADFGGIEGDHPSPAHVLYTGYAGLGTLRVPGGPPASALNGLRRRESRVGGISIRVHGEARPKRCQSRESRRFSQGFQRRPGVGSASDNGTSIAPRRVQDESLNRDRSSRRRIRAGSRSATTSRAALCEARC